MQNRTKIFQSIFPSLLLVESFVVVVAFSPALLFYYKAILIYIIFHKMMYAKEWGAMGLCFMYEGGKIVPH